MLSHAGQCLWSVRYALVFNLIPPRLFSNLFPLGGGRHVSHPVELDANFFLHQNFSLSGLRVSIEEAMISRL